MPLPEAVARGEAPGDWTEIAAAERERADGGVAQQAQLGGRAAGGWRGHFDAQLRRETRGALAVAAAEGVAELDGLGEAADVGRSVPQQLMAARQLHVARLSGRS